MLDLDFDFEWLINVEGDFSIVFGVLWLEMLLDLGKSICGSKWTSSIYNILQNCYLKKEKGNF